MTRGTQKRPEPTPSRESSHRPTLSLLASRSGALATMPASLTDSKKKTVNRYGSCAIIISGKDCSTIGPEASNGLGFKKAGCDWITNWNQGWARNLCWISDKLERFIRNATNDQKVCLGIPDKNSDLWTKNQKKYMDIRYQERELLSKL